MVKCSSPGRLHGIFFPGFSPLFGSHPILTPNATNKVFSSALLSVCIGSSVQRSGNCAKLLEFFKGLRFLQLLIQYCFLVNRALSTSLGKQNMATIGWLLGKGQQQEEAPRLCLYVVAYLTVFALFYLFSLFFGPSVSTRLGVFFARFCSFR